MTVPQAPQFRSEERLAHYHTVVEPAKRAKMTAAERQKLVGWCRGWGWGWNMTVGVCRA